MIRIETIEVDPMPGVPEHLRYGLRWYVLHGLKPGGFMLAVLEHELFEAFNRGDKESLAGLEGLVRWIYNKAPGDCHGNRETVTQWMNRGGLVGYPKKEPV